MTSLPAASGGRLRVTGSDLSTDLTECVKVTRTSRQDWTRFKVTTLLLNVALPLWCLAPEYHTHDGPMRAARTRPGPGHTRAVRY